MRGGRSVAHSYLRLAERVVYCTFPGRDQDGNMRVKYPYATLAAFMSIAPHLGSSCQNSPLTDIAAEVLTCAQFWTGDAYHLPSAEEYLRACWSVVYHGATDRGERLAIVRAGLVNRSLEVRREALRVIGSISRDELADAMPVCTTLVALVVDEREPGDVRVSATGALLREAGRAGVERDDAVFQSLMRVYKSTRNVPLRQGILPLVAGRSSPSASDQRQILDLLEESSKMDQVRLPLPAPRQWSSIADDALQTVEEREAAASALVAFAASLSHDQLTADLRPLHARILLRLLQDDDITVRESANLAACSKVVEGKGVEQLLEKSGPDLLPLIWEDEDAEFSESSLCMEI